MRPDRIPPSIGETEMNCKDFNEKWKGYEQRYPKTAKKINKFLDRMNNYLKFIEPLKGEIASENVLYALINERDDETRWKATGKILILNEKRQKQKKTEKTRGRQRLNVNVTDVKRILTECRIPHTPSFNRLNEEEYNVVYADPPWDEDYTISHSRAIENHYPTMTVEQICALKIPAAENAVLFLWVPFSKVTKGLKVIEAWGFTIKSELIWIKDRIGTGHYTRAQHEHLFIATRGNIKPPPPDSRSSSTIFAPRKRHSEKPVIFYEIIEKMYPNGKYLELFARKERIEWMSWGNQLL